MCIYTKYIHTQKNKVCAGMKSPPENDLEGGWVTYTQPNLLENNKKRIQVVVIPLGKDDIYTYIPKSA